MLTEIEKLMDEDITKIDTLLRGLRDDDFDCVIKQEKLRSQGHTLHFVVDAGLIYNYCYPEGIDPSTTGPERRAKLNPEYIADEQVTLHSIFFLNQGKDRVVFFDQYVAELEGMITQAVSHKAVQSGGGVLDLDNFHDSSDLRSLAFESFSSILADVLRHINGLRKVDNLFRSKALIIEPQDLNNAFVCRTTELIKGTKKNTDKIKEMLSGIIKDDLFESKKRDAVVFDRVLSINNFIQKFGERQDRKHVFILLTDSSIMKRLGRQLLRSKGEIEYPVINGDIVELTRSVQQTFIYLISIARHEDTSVDHRKTISNLIQLKEFNREIKDRFEQTEQLIQDKNPDKTKVDLLFSPEYEYVFENYKRLRNAFENSGLLKSFQSLYDSVKSYLNEKKLYNIKTFFQAIDSVIGDLSQELDDRHLKFLRRLKDEAIFNTSFINGIEQIKDMGSKFDLSKGADLIEGSYQHLPIFLTFSKNSEFQYQMFNILRLILTKKTEASREVCDELGGLLSRMMLVKSNVDFPVEVKLLKAFLFVILPTVDDYTERPPETPNNSIALSWLELLDQNNNIEDKELQADLIYLLCWTARRVPDYKRAKEYAEKGIAEFPEDPRFYHGLFLAEYCIYESHYNTDHSLIDKMLDSLGQASKLYAGFIRTHYLKFNTSLLSQKLFDTFNNNYCFCYTMKARYLHESNPNNHHYEITEILRTARVFLNNLKENKKFRDELPEYYDTEAHLEYLEAYHTLDKKSEKIHYAKGAIGHAISLSNHPGLIAKYNESLEMINRAILTDFK